MRSLNPERGPDLMTVQISGKNIDVGESLRGEIRERLDGALAKYFRGGFSGHVTLAREAARFRAECRLHLDTGMMLRAAGEAADAYQSFDKAAERIEKQLRRYGRRLNDHRARDIPESGILAADYTLAGIGDDEEAESGDGAANPAVVAESHMQLRSMTVGMAVMALDLADEPVMLFTNAANGRLNIVYRRKDGNIGWVDPQTAG